MDPTVPCYDASIKSMYYDNLTYDACSNARAWSFLIYDASFQWTDRCHYFVTIDPVIPEAYIQSANAKKTPISQSTSRRYHWTWGHALAGKYVLHCKLQYYNGKSSIFSTYMILWLFVDGS